MRLVAAAILLPVLFSFAAAQSGSGGVSVSQAWSRATPGGARNGAAYFQVTAKGAGGDKLVAARSDAADRVELHTHLHEGGVMRMRQVEAIELPAGKTVTLEPGGFHLMLLNLKRPLKAGEDLELTLVFEKAGEVAVKATVEPIGAKGPAGGHMGQGHGSGHMQKH
ncbi:MAG: copper chaperone PCu(A)C [Hyphomicrobiaceae bacterium]|nr:copper chaperone PCu(A)C [Hyphomicrobiaceae bacterium]